VGVTGYVGLMGSGKTRRVVRHCLDALKEGRDVYANFRLGFRTEGWMVPLCGRSVHYRTYRTTHEAESYEFRGRTPVLDYVGREQGWRFGRGFVSDDKAQVLESWEQLQALRVFRDEMGRSHKVRVVRDEAGEWVSERECAVWDCDGCSKGVTVAIDELNLWAPSRMWQDMQLGTLTRWAYARKDGMDIVWSAQHEARIDKVPREVTDFIYTCTALGGSAPLMRLQMFQLRRWVPALLTEKNRVVAGEGARSSGAIGGFEWPEFVVRFGRKLTTREEEAYDTYEHVQGSGHLASARRGAPGGARSAGVRPRPAVTVGRSEAEQTRVARLDGRRSSTVSPARPVAALREAAGVVRRGVDR